MPPSSFLEISGESGGGQLLRSSLSLSMVTGRPFRMVNIRGKRPKPGLMRQHLTCVKAAAEVCDAIVDGAQLGSSELIFSPRKIRSGDYLFNIGSGGSTTLVLQTVLPALLYAETASTLRIEGGTHNPLAPPFEFIERCFLPVIKRMGAEVEVSLEKPGFMEAGGGVLRAKIQPIKQWQTLKLVERGELQETFGRVLHAHLKGDIAHRAISSAAKMLNWPDEKIELRYANESVGPGSVIYVGARFEHVSEISSGVAQHGRTAEVIGRSAAKKLCDYLSSEAPVGEHLSDQLLLPMALGGGGLFYTRFISDHTETNAGLIEKFLPVRCAVEEVSRGIKAVSVSSVVRNNA